MAVKYSVNIVGEVNLPEGATPIEEDGRFVGYRTKDGEQKLVLEVFKDTIILHREHLDLSEAGTIIRGNDS